MTTAVFYSYKDFKDSAINFEFFKRLTLRDDIFVYLSYNDNKYLKLDEIPSNYFCKKMDFNVDFVDWANLLEHVKIDDYSHFIFINSSCIGPIVPVYVRQNWLELLKANLVNGVHALSPIIEIPPDSNGTKIIDKFKYLERHDKFIPFMHTYFVFLDRIALDILIRYNFFSKNVSKKLAIDVYERGMSSILINERINIGSFLKYYQNFNFLDKNKWVPENMKFGKGTCPEIPGNYFGADLDIFELMFFKNIRHPNSHRSINLSGIPDHSSKYISYILLKDVSN